MTVTRDATSLRYIPQSGAEWTALLAGTGIPNPTVLHLCQEATGDLVDALGTGQILAVAGSPSYQQSVSGWATKAVLCTDGSTSIFKNTAWPNASSLVFAYMSFPASTGGTERSVLTLGASYNAQVAIELKISSNPTIPALATHGDVLTNGASSSAGVHPVLLQANKTAGSAVVQTDLETITHATTGADNLGTLALGGDNVNYWESAGVGCLYLAGWTAYEPDATARALLLDRLTNGPAGTITQDATSAKYIPQTAAEWTSMLAGSGINNPFLLYRCQEASGNLVDSITGTAAMVPTGSPGYRQAVSGWSSKAVHVTNGNCFFGSDSSLPDVSSTSMMLLAWVKTPTNFGAGTYALAFGGTYHHQVGWFGSTGGGGTLHVGAGFTTSGGFSSGVVQGSVDQRAQVLPVIVQWVHGTATITVQTSLETVQAAGVTSTPTGKELMFGADNGAITDLGEDLEILYAAVWHGADAEIDGTQRADLITRMSTGPVVLTSIAVTPSTDSLDVSDTDQLTATGTYSDMTTADVTNDAIWTSDDAGVVTVDSAGIITAIGAGGPTNVNATLSAIVGSCAVTVLAPAVLDGVTTAPTYISALVAGDSEQLAATAHYSDNTSVDVASTATWTTSDAAVATVSTTGVVRGVAFGHAIITATFDGFAGTTQVDVLPVPVDHVDIALGRIPDQFKGPNSKRGPQ